MTTHQQKAIWELCRQGFHAVADEAQAAWSRGKDFRPSEPLPLTRGVMELIRIANWESESQAA